MNNRTQKLVDALNAVLGDSIKNVQVAFDQITLDITAENLIKVATLLRDDPALQFQQLTDLCGIDYSQLNANEWQTDNASATGFSRAVDAHSSGRLMFGEELDETNNSKRFATIYQLISYAHNWRITMRVYAENDDFPIMDSVVPIWNGANWFERESFDLFGILYNGHPDLRRILTDYGFVGHPFRKDFPLVGHVEMRYDEDKKRVIYEPVTIDPRVLVPKVKREDHRYIAEDSAEASE